jgi:hypothetical protein
MRPQRYKNRHSGNVMRRLMIILYFSSVAAIAQQNLTSQWQEKLSDFYKLQPPVSLHLFFSQPAYAPGDTAYFRAAFLSAADLLPVKGDQIIALDVVNNLGEVLLHQEFRMKDGWSGNQIVWPADFAPGIYRVVAYSDWMRNFSNSLFFQTELTVSGPTDFVCTKGEAGLNYYPEGGRLVAGVVNKVVVATADAQQVLVSDSKGQSVAESVTNEAGYGFFFITPDSDETYTIKSAADSIQMQAKADGIALQLTPVSDGIGSHRLILQASRSFPGRQQDLVLTVARHDQIYYSAMLRFEDRDYLATAIPSSVLPMGLCFLSINTMTGDELASRVFFNQAQSPLRPVTDLSKREVNVREELKVDFSLKDQLGTPELARISVSVYQTELFEKSPSRNPIDEYLLPVSDFSERSNRFWEYSNDPATLDHYLITQRWPWYTWKQVLHSKPSPSYAFKDHQFIRGRLVDANSGRPMEEVVSVTFYFSNTGKVYTIWTDASGLLEAYFLFDYYGDEELFYWIEKNGMRIKGVRLELDNDLPKYGRVEKPEVRSTPDNYYAYANFRSEIFQSYFYFIEKKLPVNLQIVSPNHVLEGFLSGVDIDIDLDDYLRFPTMQETLREVVPFLSCVRTKGQDVVRVYRPDIHQVSSGPPIFMIDGVITDDVDYFLGLDPEKVDKIKLVQSSAKLNKLGVLGRNGFVLVETKIQNNMLNVPQENSYLTIKGLTRELQFPSELPHWQKSNTRSPRPKPMLFWQPTLQLDGEGKTSFVVQTSDDTGQFVVHIEGLTTSGVPFVVKEHFTVRYDR